ncbi:MAG: hypothetical protein HYT70_01315 [Candidatus Aenigmarchaeota archaeon]|nr:hypothetical protein [Candidatus Aenigmarchaeota archaeon]
MFGWVKRLFKRSEALQSASSDLTSLQSDTQALENQSLQSASNISDIDQTESRPLEIEKGSLHLGIAAGYTGRVLRDIEASLLRIEAQMVTKDWMTLQVKDDIDKRLETIQEALYGISGIAKTLPPSEQAKIMDKIQSIESNLPLTPQMQRIMAVLELNKEISYDELAAKLGIQVSALRGLLSQMAKRTQRIVRTEKEGKGWVKISETTL